MAGTGRPHQVAVAASGVLSQGHIARIQAKPESIEYFRIKLPFSPMVLPGAPPEERTAVSVRRRHATVRKVFSHGCRTKA
jgi:hypothetical protein